MQGKIGEFMSKLCYAPKRQNVVLKLFKKRLENKVKNRSISLKKCKNKADVFINIKFHRHLFQQD